MKKIIFIMTTVFGLTSCSDENNDVRQNSSQDFSNDILDHMVKTVEQDSGFDARNNNNNNNRFKNDVSAIPKDKKLSNKLQGAWELSSDNSLQFLNVNLKPRFKVVFKDSLSTLVTEWGEISYNSSAKFYSTEHASDILEYYVSKDKKLNLTKFDYYNNDLKFKTTPTLDTISFLITFADNDNVILSDGFDKYKLTRKK